MSGTLYVLDSDANSLKICVVAEASTCSVSIVSVRSLSDLPKTCIPSFPKAGLPLYACDSGLIIQDVNAAATFIGAHIMLKIQIGRAHV